MYLWGTYGFILSLLHSYAPTPTPPPPTPSQPYQGPSKTTSSHLVFLCKKRHHFIEIEVFWKKVFFILSIFIDKKNICHWQRMWCKNELRVKPVSGFCLSLGYRIPCGLFTPGSFYPVVFANGLVLKNLAKWRDFHYSQIFSQTVTFRGFYICL